MNSRYKSNSVCYKEREFNSGECFFSRYKLIKNAKFVSGTKTEENGDKLLL